MKKYLVVIFMAVLLSSCTLFGGKNGENGNLTGNGKQESKGSNFSGTLKDVIAKNTPMKCESKVEGEDGQGSMSGIVQGNKYIGRMNMNGKRANILMRDNCMWSWEEGSSNGIKTCFEVEEGSEGGLWGDVDSRQLNENVDCAPTIISPTTFSLPSGVNFLDMDEMMSGELTPEQMKQLEEMSEE